MTDFDQQVVQPQAPSRFTAITADSYTLLLTVGLIVLVISFAYLATVWFHCYGGLAAKPVIGKVTAVSDRGVKINIGSKQGLVPKGKLLALRRGAFLADLSVQIADADGATVREDGEARTVAKGDTVIFSPLDRQ